LLSKKDARERQQKSRDRKKLPEPKKPKPLSVTSRKDAVGNDAESADASAEKRKAENADLAQTTEEKAAKASAHYLAEFTAACRMYLPKITAEADRQKARLLASELTTGKSRAKAA
jgi:hypothetical protein